MIRAIFAATIMLSFGLWGGVTVLTGILAPPISLAFSSEDEASATSKPTVAVTESEADTMLQFSLEVGNRMYPGWKEEHDVRIDTDFYLGDTEFTAHAARFLPDFRMKDGEPFSASTEMLNPALQVIVSNDSAAVDTAWAFQNFPPHYSQRSFFTFKILRIGRIDDNQTEVD